MKLGHHQSAQPVARGGIQGVLAFKAYSIIDIFSRKIVGWRVEEREVDALAVKMFEDAFTDLGVPAAVQADSGPAMRSHDLKNLLADHGVVETHNRPRVSNDNPFSESEFRTMKYRPNYPGIFVTIDDARAYMAQYVPWYNAQHKHSGIGLFSPSQVHDSTWRQHWQRREHTQQTYYQDPQNGSDKSHEHRARQPSASTSPPPNDSKRLDNARNDVCSRTLHDRAGRGCRPRDEIWRSCACEGDRNH